MAGGGAISGQTAVANRIHVITPCWPTPARFNNPLLKDVTFTLDSFKTLGMVCFDPEILVVPPELPRTRPGMSSLLYAKENTVKVATPGHSTSHHIAAIQLAKEYGLKFEYLHNDSASVQMQQLMGGHCDAAMMAAGETVSQIGDGTIIDWL